MTPRCWSRSTSCWLIQRRRTWRCWSPSSPCGGQLPYSLGGRKRVATGRAFTRSASGRIGAGCPPDPFGTYDPLAFELGGVRCRPDRRLAVVVLGVLLRVAAGLSLMLLLLLGHRRVLLVGCGALLLRRLRRRSAGAAVEADFGHVDVVVDHGLVVDVCDVDASEIVHRAIVDEHAAPPKAARIAHAGIAKSVIDATVEADVWSPITRVPKIDAIPPAPIARGPKQAHRGGQYPRPGHPIVAVVTPCPVTRRPDIAGPGNWRLLVDRQHRRRDGDRDDLRRGFRHASNSREQKQA